MLSDLVKLQDLLFLGRVSTDLPILSRSVRTISGSLFFVTVQ